MTHLYEALSWTIDEPDRPREYVIHNDGELLANVERVAVPRQDAAGVPYADPHAHHDESRIVVRVVGADGTPCFFIDHARNPMGLSPVNVVAPSGEPIGLLTVKTGGLKAVFTLFSKPTETVYLLRDATGRPLATMRESMDPQVMGTLSDAAGAELGRFAVERSPYEGPKRRRTMRLSQPLAEPLRTLAIASLIGLELIIPKTIL